MFKTALELNPNQEQAIRHALAWIVGAGLTGAGARSLLALGEYATRPPETTTYKTNPTVVDIPFKVRTNKPKQQAEVRGRSLDFSKRAWPDEPKGYAKGLGDYDPGIYFSGRRKPTLVSQLEPNRSYLPMGLQRFLPAESKSSTGYENDRPIAYAKELGSHASNLYFSGLRKPTLVSQLDPYKRSLPTGLETFPPGEARVPKRYEGFIPGSFSQIASGQIPGIAKDNPTVYEDMVDGLRPTDIANSKPFNQYYYDEKSRVPLVRLMQKHEQHLPIDLYQPDINSIIKRPDYRAGSFSYEQEPEQAIPISPRMLQDYKNPNNYYSRSLVGPGLVPTPPPGSGKDTREEVEPGSTGLKPTSPGQAGVSKARPQFNEPETPVIQGTSKAGKLPTTAGFTKDSANLSKRAWSRPGESAGETALRLFLGDGAQHRDQVPWYLASIMLGAPLAAYGGYKFIDNHLKGERKRDIDDRLEDAKQRYQKATQEQLGIVKDSVDRFLQSEFAIDEAVSSTSFAKKADDSTLGRWGKYLGVAPDNVTDSMLLPWNWLPESTVRDLVPWYVALGSGVGLGTGAAMYNYTRAYDPEREKAKDIKKQIEQSNALRPPPLYANVIPVDEAGRRLSPEALKKQKELEEQAELESTLKAGSDITAKAGDFVARLLGSV